jgi:hypothetical protein
MTVLPSPRESLLLGKPRECGFAILALAFESHFTPPPTPHIYILYTHTLSVLTASGAASR